MADNKTRTSPKERVKLIYEKLAVSLDKGLRKVECIDDGNQAIKDFRDDLAEELRSQISHVRDEMQRCVKDMPWDKLMIAFFGETNAGKSTIIETFRILFKQRKEGSRSLFGAVINAIKFLFSPARWFNSDGLIVGDGRHDFTKEYHDYELSVNDKPFVLIDVPGIEGNESQFKNDISDALRRAHIVFYVQGHNKKPDEATAKKIKDYLSDWTKVYSVQNIRGAVSNYDEEEERETLLTPNIVKTEGLIQEKFREVLGDVYMGNIPLQALLAMCAKAKFSRKRQDLIKAQKKVIEYFGSADKVLEFSNFQEVVKLVGYLSEHFVDQIVDANRTKLRSLARHADESVYTVLNERNEQIEKLRQQLQSYKRDVERITDSCVYRVFSSQLPAVIDGCMSNLKHKLISIIDDDSDTDVKRAKAKQVLTGLRGNIRDQSKSVFDKEMKEMRQELARKKKGIRGLESIAINGRVLSPDVKLDLDCVMDNLDINLGDIGSFALGVAGAAATGAAIGSIIPGVGSAIGAGFGAAVGFVHQKYLSDREEKKKAEAKKNLQKSIASATDRIKLQLRAMEADFRDELQEEQRKVDESIDAVLRKIEAIMEAGGHIRKDLDQFSKYI